MKKLHVFLLAAVFFLQNGIAGDESGQYSQTYTIFLKGIPSGKEAVVEKRDNRGNLVAATENDLLVTDGLETKRMVFTTRMVLEKSTMKPKSYSFQYATGSTGDSYQVDVLNDQITRTLNRGGQTSVVTATLEPGMIILDFNVYHQYDYLVRKYNEKSGGRQLFADFIPVIGSDIPIALTSLGTSNLAYKGGELQVKNYKIEFVGLRSGTVSVDKGNRLVRLVMPDQDLEVVREDLASGDNQ